MEYLQYLNRYLLELLKSIVLNLIINGIPSIHKFIEKFIG